MTVEIHEPQIETAEHQIERLSKFIAFEIPGEPSQSESAVDCAIRLLKSHYPAKSGARLL